MRRVLLCLLSSLVIVSAGCTRTDFHLEPLAPQSSEGALSGRVVQALSGTELPTAVEGAEIVVLGSNLRARSGADGVFVLAGLPAAEYRLHLRWATPAGEKKQKLVGPITVVAGSTRPLGDLALQSSAEVVGRVLLEGSASSAGALVFVTGTSFAALVGADGRYILRGLPEGTLRITGYRDGYAAASTGELELRGGLRTDGADLVLHRAEPGPATGAIRGAVRLSGRDAHQGVLVRPLLFASSAAPSAELPSVTTASDGGFELAGLAAGLYSLRFELDGRTLGEVSHLVLGAGERLTLSQAVVLSIEAPLSSADAGIDPPPAGVDGGVIGGCRSADQCPAGLTCRDGLCRNCEFDSDCRATFHCRGALCVRECVKNADCAKGLACQDGACGACVIHAECSAGEICDSGRCEAGDCATAADCAAASPGKICRAHRCSDCLQDLDCGATSLCLNGACKAGDCRSNGDCTGKVCKSNFCVACSAHADCATSGMVCDGGACVFGECAATSDCAGLGKAGKICRARACVDCAQDGDCPSGTVCLSGGVCATGNCHVDGDCNKRLCKSNVCSACVKGECGSGKVCAFGQCEFGNCGVNADCAAGQVCQNFVCGACTADAQCVAGSLCLGGACKPGSCRDDSGCASKQVCQANQCTGNCRLDSDCASNQVCKTNVCSGGCRTLADCPANQICDAANLCVGECRTSAQCAGGKVCKSNTCSPCLNDSDCGQGRLCDQPTGACFTGDCRLNSTCNPGFDCLSFTCTQVAPTALLTATLDSNPDSILASAISKRIFFVTVKSNPDTRSLTAFDTGTGTQAWKIALEPGLYDAPPFAVIPAKGMAPSGEMILLVVGGKLTFYDSASGQLLWASTVSAGTETVSNFRHFPFHCVGLGGDELRIYTANYSSPTLEAYDLKGNLLWSKNPNASANRLLCGTNALLVVGGDYLSQLDYQTGATLTRDTWPQGSSGLYSIQIAALRRAGGFDEVIATGTGGVTVGMRIGGSPPQLFRTQTQAAAPLLDAAGNITVVDYDWTLLDAAGAIRNATFAPYTGKPALAIFNNRSVQDGAGNFYAAQDTGGRRLFAAYRFDAQGNQQVVYSFIPSSLKSFYPLAPHISPDGDLWITAVDLNDLIRLVRLRPVLPLVKPKRTWGLNGGDDQRLYRAPVDSPCLGDGDCTAPKGCLLGRCVGNCRANADCTVTGETCKNNVCKP